MNKKFLSAILFGALMVTSTGTFVSCKDYDDDIQELSNEKDKLAQQIAELEKQVSDAATKAELEALKNSLNSANANLDEIKKALDELKKGLTSLVFKPGFYYGGIEAMKVNVFHYTPWIINEEINADEDFLAKEAPEQKTAEVEMAPNLYAEYHINPSTVTKEDIAEVTFLTADKEYEDVKSEEGRALTDAIKTKVIDYVVEQGLLKVTAVIEDGSIKMEGEKVTVLAAQAKLKKADGTNAVVTSDYAVVRSDIANGFTLNLIGETEEDCVELYSTAEEAKADENEIQLELPWNSEGLDIAKVIHTHYMGSDGKVAVLDTKNAMFEYSYQLVGWYSGTNKTSESAHAAIEGSVIRPQMTAEGKQQAYGAEQSKATIGRRPIVRIVLTDKVTGEVAAVGYLPFVIVAETAAEPEWAVEEVEYPFTDKFTLACEADKVSLKLDWHQVEEELIALLNISKDEFHANYVLDDNDADNYSVIQYNGTDKDSKPLAKEDMIGKVSMPQGDEDPDQTKILTWNIEHNDAYQLFKAGKEELVARVRFTSESERMYVYVTLTWTPEELNITPTGDILDDSKLKEYWYAHNNLVAETGKEDIHANVEVVGTAEADCEFVTDMLNTFDGEKLTVANVNEVYVDFQDAELKKTFVFDKTQTPDEVVGVSGTTYYLAPSEGGNELRAYLKEADRDALASTGYKVVAKIEESKISLVDEEYAKDILNKADHKELGEGETFTASVAIKAACKDGKEVALTNNTFFVKFLRPISVADPGKTNFVDAETNGSEAKLVLTFTDWREHNFDNEIVTKGQNYYTYYGIESIEWIKDEVTTDMGNGGKLFEIAPNIEFNFTAPTGTISKDNLGKFTYSNNEATVSEFEIYVPLNVTYKWGTIKTSVTIVVGKTIEN